MSGKKSEAAMQQAREQFKAVTAVEDESTINHYLEACGYEAENAVNLYFTRANEERDVRMAGGGGGESRRGSRHRDQTHEAQDDEQVMISSDDEIEIVRAPARPRRAAASAAAARNGRLNNESETGRSRGGKWQGQRGGRQPQSQTGGQSSSRSAYEEQEDDEVRAPIPSTQGTLIPHSFSEQYGTHHRFAQSSAFGRPVDFREIAASQERTMREGRRNGVGRGQGALLIEDAEVAAAEPSTSGAEAASRDAKGAANLQQLYKQPTDIMFQADWDTTKAYASSDDRWLLVNVQDLTEFKCHILNRDVWANSGVKALIESNFVFYQVMRSSTDGERLCNYYHLQEFPSIFIVDPRTGELVHTLHLPNKIDPLSLSDQLTTFLDKASNLQTYDLVNFSQKPTSSSSHSSTPALMATDEPMVISSNGTSNDQRQMRKRKAEVNGEIEAKKGRDTAQNGRDDVDEILNHDTSVMSLIDQEEWLNETAQTGILCKLRLKFPDNRHTTIEISEDSKLKALYKFIHGQGLNPLEHVFVLQFPRRIYSIDQLEKTLKELGFQGNEVVHVETK